MNPVDQVLEAFANVEGNVSAYPFTIEGMNIVGAVSTVINRDKAKYAELCAEAMAMVAEETQYD